MYRDADGKLLNIPNNVKNMSVLQYVKAIFTDFNTSKNYFHYLKDSIQAFFLGIAAQIAAVFVLFFWLVSFFTFPIWIWVYAKMKISSARKEKEISKQKLSKFVNDDTPKK